MNLHDKSSLSRWACSRGYEFSSAHSPSVVHVLALRKEPVCPRFMEPDLAVIVRPRGEADGLFDRHRYAGRLTLTNNA
jgi:hypothetical protein